VGYASVMWLGFGEALAAVAGALTGLLFVALSVKGRAGCITQAWLVICPGTWPGVDLC